MRYLTDQHIYTPGPVKMSEETTSIGGKQVPYFRNEEFSKILLECEENLLKLVNAPESSRVIFLTASGTGAMEASVMNLLNEEDYALVINGGDFGQRFINLCNIHNIRNIELKPDHNNLSGEADLKQHVTKVSTLLVNAHETSIGLLYDLDTIGNFCNKNNIFNIVDAISMFITDRLDMQSQYIDALILSSQKGLALAPGLSMIVLSPKAQKRINQRVPLYFDFKLYLKDGKRGQTPFTPAVSIILQLHARLKQIMKIGIDKERENAKLLAEYFRKSIQKLPLKPFTQFMPNAMTALTPTDNKKACDIVSDLKKYNVIVTPNGGELKEKIFRVAHMGAMTKEYLDILIDALFEYYGEKK